MSAIKKAPPDPGPGGDRGARVQLVIFDCDGVLIDSEPIASRVLAQRLAAVGLAMPLEDVMRTFVGRTRAACIELGARMLGRPLPDEFGAQWDAALYAALEREVKPVAGIPELLGAMPLPYCVASNGERERMSLALRAAGLMPLVAGRLFTASEVARPKPAPDLFLHAAKSMGVAPARCAVIEDTPTGVKAAVAAGMKVFGYAAAAHTDEGALRAAGAITFRDMESVPALLELR
jgi:HAD superfamily hydrolase (TIGR01509 family)